MRKRDTARFVNGVLAALITVFFLVHGTMGSLSAVFRFTNEFPWLVWGAVIVMCMHISMSVITSMEQLNDTENPPSDRKKRHLALKWVTGGLLAIVAIVHIVLPKTTVTAAAVIILVSIVLAVHLCVGGKSLLKDLGIDRRYKMAFRVVVCVFAALFAAAMIGVML